MTAGVPHEDITYKVIGAAMRVHNDIGPGLKEVMYGRALSAAMQGIDSLSRKRNLMRCDSMTDRSLVSFTWTILSRSQWSSRIRPSLIC